MIKSIRIQNIALIELAEIDFFSGLSVLSGETGAGKTVIINAINFSLGAKSDKTLIRHGENYCQTEACFTDLSNQTKEVLTELDIEFDDEIIIKRKLTVDGRSDIKINGQTVTLSMLKKLTLTLCDIYGQSEHYSLLSAQNQLKVLDSYIGKPIFDLKEKTLSYIETIKKARKILEENGGDEYSRSIRLDVLSYQINEIDKAELYDGEEDELLEKKKVFANAQKIGESLSLVNSSISDDGGILDILSTAVNKLSQISEYKSDYSDLYDRLYSIKADVDDISYTASALIDGIDFDEQEKQRVEDRLDLIKGLKRKYGNSYSEIMEFYQKCSIEYENLQNFAELSKRCEKEIQESEDALNLLYNEMNVLRLNGADKFSQSVESELATLGMKSAKFNVSVSQGDFKLSKDGNNEVEFLFSANKGEPLKNMSKIISGGEMSRFMLALKIVAGEMGETYIFDEIDAGISGEVAKIVAQKFIKLSKSTQIITISHLPQIVAYADNNYLIKKSENGEKTTTNVLSLDENGRINEIMRLTGGGDEEVARLNAVSSIQSANEYKKSI
ncbi:MAG: DNA repair protein RecN [Clostridiales bacterium]|nr:DNA repair protein RecN [Clostridiales bacterium]